MTAQLKNKSTFISMICVCLRNTPQVALMVRHTVTVCCDDYCHRILADIDLNQMYGCVPD